MSYISIIDYVVLIFGCSRIIYLKDFFFCYLDSLFFSFPFLFFLCGSSNESSEMFVRLLMVSWRLCLNSNSPFLPPHLNILSSKVCFVIIQCVLHSLIPLRPVQFNPICMHECMYLSFFLAFFPQGEGKINL